LCAQRLCSPRLWFCECDWETFHSHCKPGGTFV